MECNICGRDFDNKISLANHRRWHNLPEYKEFQNNVRKKLSAFRKENPLLNHKADCKCAVCIQKEGFNYRFGKTGEESYQWKGKEVSYKVLHKWVRKYKPKPEFCEICGKKPPFDVANISGEYKRDLNDFQWICRSCHVKSDNRVKNLVFNKEE